MTNIIKAKYIDLMVDWSFKRVFGTEVNKDILIEFGNLTSVKQFVHDSGLNFERHSGKELGCLHAHH